MQENYNEGALNLKPFLVDVPVKLNVFVRPEMLEKVFSVVKTARPSILFLVSDGPRQHVATDKERVAKSRRVVETVDWDCKVYKLYSDVNKGMITTGKEAREFIFSKVDRCIMLEDDVVPSVSFFRFCAELLEKYKNDLRVHRVCGMNHLGLYETGGSDYFFSKEGAIWGYAIWKRTYENFDYEFSYAKDSYVMNLLHKQTNKPKEMWKQYVAYSKGEDFKRIKAGPEFFYESATNLHNQLNIVASKNMVCNIGVGEGSLHAPDSMKLLPKGIAQVFYMDTYEYTFPLKHPQFVIEDEAYRKKVNRIMGWGHPLVKIYRRIEVMIRKVIFASKK